MELKVKLSQHAKAVQKFPIRRGGLSGLVTFALQK
jgi:hypothetical protein